MRPDMRSKAESNKTKEERKGETVSQICKEGPLKALKAISKGITWFNFCF